ncbi:unnamed protein product, partial [Tetraodon nigroviridis]
MSSPASTPGRKRGRNANPGTPSSEGPTSPPSQRRRGQDSSTGDLMPMPTSPATDLLSPAAAQDASLFSSPRPSYLGNPNEADMSSPLMYGTPSSRVEGTPRSSVRGTPARQRPDLGSVRKAPQVDLHSEPPSADGAAASEPSAGQRLVIWGTDVNVGTCKEKFQVRPPLCPGFSQSGRWLLKGNRGLFCLQRFLQRFVDPTSSEDENAGLDLNEPLYMQKLEEISVVGDPVLNVNCLHVRSFDAELYRQLICYPQEVIPTFDMAVNELFFERFPDSILEYQIQVRPYNALKTKNMRSLNPEDIDQLITINGMVIRTSQLIPEMQEAFFQCQVCAFTTRVEVDRGRIAEPAVCRHCNNTHSLALIHNRSVFSDKQMVKIQESPEDMPAGQTPHTTIVYAHNDLVDKVQPGDRVNITGEATAKVEGRGSALTSASSRRPRRHLQGGAHARQPHPEQREVRVQDPHRRHPLPQDGREAPARPGRGGGAEALHRGPRAGAEGAGRQAGRVRAPLLRPGAQHLRARGHQKGNFTAAVWRNSQGLQPDGPRPLPRRGQHPAVRRPWNQQVPAAAVRLQPGAARTVHVGQRLQRRGPHRLRDEGPGDPAAGPADGSAGAQRQRHLLHRRVRQDERQHALRAARGHGAADALHRQGIICQLNARTAVLAAANPVESQWNPKKTTIENIQLPHTLLSRFDLIFLMLDPQDEAYDRRLAHHLVALYYQSEEQMEEEFLDMAVLRDYIAYARTYISPRLSEEASQALIEVRELARPRAPRWWRPTSERVSMSPQAYVDMRKIGSGRGMVSAYPRQLESLIRLAEAHAKVRFSEKVETIDVEEAKRLHREALKQSATDPRTGFVDISILTTGMSATARKRREEVAQALRKLIQTKGKTPAMKYQQLLDDLRAQSESAITKELFDEALRALADEDFLTVTGKTVRLL